MNKCIVAFQRGASTHPYIKDWDSYINYIRPSKSNFCCRELLEHIKVFFVNFAEFDVLNIGEIHISRTNLHKKPFLFQVVEVYHRGIDAKELDKCPYCSAEFELKEVSP